MNILPKYLTKGDNQVAKSEVVKSNPPIQFPPQPIVRQQSEVAAQAAQNYHDMVTSLASANAELNVALNHIQLLQERIEALVEDNHVLIEDRDYHRDRHTQIETSLRNAGAILCEVLRIPNRNPASTPTSVEEDDERINAAVAAVASELATSKTHSTN